MSRIIFSRNEMSGALLRAVTCSWLLGLLVVVFGSIPVEAQPCPRDRAMWVYTGRNHPDVVRDDIAQANLLNFAEGNDIRPGIRDFFLSVQMNCTESGERVRCHVRDENALRDFIKAAHGKGFRVHALRGGVRERPEVPIWGSAELALEEHHAKVHAMVQAVLEFNDGEADRFDGIHLDIEPYTLRQYRQADDAGKQAIILQFLMLNESIVQMLEGEELDYSIAVGPGWHGHEPPPPDLRLKFHGKVKYPTMHLLDMVKTIALMVYINDPTRLINKTRSVIEYANLPEVGAAVYLGVQTCPGREGTFGDGTQSQMEQALCLVHDEFKTFDSFLGFSYFNYTCYKDMEE